MDVRLPDIDGLEATRRIRAGLGADVRVVSFSASALAHEQQRYLEAGFNAFLAKPVRFDVLTRLLEQLLGAVFEIPVGAETVQAPVTAPVRLEVPAKLRQRLKSAAEESNITELRRTLAELVQGGEPYRALAAALQAHVETYDMEAFLKVLGEAVVVPEDASGT